MKIFLAKKAGFCFGVERAVKTVKETNRNSNQKVYTLGPIIHNPQVIEEFKKNGVFPITLEEAMNLSQGIVVIRSHGVSADVMNQLKSQKGITVIDATCPFVMTVHEKVQFLESQDYEVVIIGKKDHPEVKGIIGYCQKEPYVINSIKDIHFTVKKKMKLGIVAQTTTLLKHFQNIISYLIPCSKEVLIFNTICSATEARQEEAKNLSKVVDQIIVIGGKNSSNSNKLSEICSLSQKEVFFIETVDELDFKAIKPESIIGITAGASTPWESINAVIGQLEKKFNTQSIIFNSKGD